MKYYHLWSRHGALDTLFRIYQPIVWFGESMSLDIASANFRGHIFPFVWKSRICYFRHFNNPKKTEWLEGDLKEYRMHTFLTDSLLI